MALFQTTCFKKGFNLFLFSVCLIFNGSIVYGVLVQEVQFPDQTQIGNLPLVLNGVGLRKATVFKVKVYLAGLYLEQKSHDPEKILNSKKPKKLVMHFLRDVPSEKLIEAWKDGFGKNCETLCSELTPALKQLEKIMVDVKKGEVMNISFHFDSIEVSVNGGASQKVSGQGFSRILLATWLGSYPPNPELKSGMLGLESL